MIHEDQVALGAEDVQHNLIARLQGELRQAQRMEVIGAMAGGVAHDFNNSLNVIVGYGSILLEELPAESPYRLPLQEILNASDRAAALTRKLMILGKDQPLEIRAVKIDEIIAAAQKMIQRIAGADILLAIDAATVSPVVLGDSLLLEQLVLNMAMVARNAMPAGGTMTISTGEQKVTDGSRSLPPGTYGVITVALSVEITDLDRPIIHEIIEKHQGFVSLSNQPGQGSLCRFFIPTQRDQGGKSILIIDPDRDLCELTCTILSSFDFNTLAATDQKEAHEIFYANRHSIGLIILEGEDMELYREMIESSPPVKVLLLSDQPPSRAAERDREVLLKPYTPLDLINKIRTIFSS